MQCLLKDFGVELPGPSEHKNDMPLPAFLQAAAAPCQKSSSRASSIVPEEVAANAPPTSTHWELDTMVDFAFVSEAPLGNHCL